jgi:hypothetical protein
VNPEAQRIAIAKVVGYPNPRMGLFNRCYAGELPNLEDVPDYLNDLNAMHEAENAVIRPKRFWYQYCLKLPGRSFDESIGATAAQRAEAFLRTLGLWKEGA